MTNNELINWFIPPERIRGRTNIELARIFVFTHLFGPLIAQPMAVYLYVVEPVHNYAFYTIAAAISAFWLLPFLLKLSGNMTVMALLSFQGLASASLFGTYHWGGFSSPFLPWLIISLLLGFFYLSKRVKLVLTLFAADIVVFLAVFLQWGFPERVPIEDLHYLGWLSIVAATTYMSWMALYYARMVAMRTELQVEAERYLQASAELQKAREISERVGQERSQFFSKMSHELRTPLNAIIGYSELLLEDSEETADDNTQRSRDIGRINAAGKHLLSLVSDVLDSETLESDATNIQVQNFTLKSLCDHVEASALPLIEKNGNRLIVDCPQPDETIATDRQKLQQMLINLLSNAAKFTKNGQVTMRLVVEDGLADDRLHAEVIDTGIGISKENVAKLFDQYIQADATISNRFGGTGIGLSIARKFSMLLGGSINVESSPGKGSRFYIDIPANLKPKDMSNGQDNTEDHPDREPVGHFIQSEAA